MASGIDSAAVRRVTLGNGLTVLIHRNPAAPVVAINTYVKAGYFDETDDVVGIAHVLEHMFFKGTARRGVGEISKATKAVGGYLNAHTIYDHTSYYTVLPSSSLAEGLDIQADAYANSVIDAGELAKELEVIIQEAKRKSDNPGAVTTETLYALLHDTHRIRRWRIGREPGLRALTRDQLVGFYRNFYVPSNTVLSIAGDVDLDTTQTMVERAYGALPAHDPARSAGPRETEHTGFRYQELDGDVAQAQLAFGWRTIAHQHPDTPALDMVAAVLGSGRASRLYRAVRERKLAGSVSAYHYTPGDLGIFVLDAEAEPHVARAAACAMWDQLRVVRNGAVTADEVERAKRLFASRWARRLETAEGRAAYLAEWEAQGGWQLGDAYHDAFLRVTANDVTRVAEQYLSPDRAGVVVYRPRNAVWAAVDTPTHATAGATTSSSLGTSSSNGAGVANTTAVPFAESAQALRTLLDQSSSVPLEPTPPASTESRVSRGAATWVREESGVRVYQTENGIPVLIVNRPSAAVTYMGVFAAGGAVHESTAQAGITTLAARAVPKGTATRTAVQLAEAAELLGGSISSSVGTESFGWSISVPSDNAAAAITLLGDVVQHAVIDDAVVDTERAALLSDLAQLRDDMYRYPMRLLQDVTFADHPYGISTSGTDASVRSLTMADVRAWYQARLRHAPFVITIVGAVDADAMAQCAAQAFSELTMGTRTDVAPPVWPASHAHKIESRDKAQTALALAFPGPTRQDPARFAARMVSTIASGLGGRFFDELRDRQSLAYTVHAFTSEFREAGLFVSYIATSPDREAVAREGLLREFEKLRNAPVTPDELTSAKRYLTGMHDIRQERGGSVLGDVVDAWLFGASLTELDRFVDNVNAVTADDILTLARTYFDPERRVEGIVRGMGRTV